MCLCVLTDDNREFLEIGSGKKSYNLYSDLIMNNIKEIRDKI